MKCTPQRSLLEGSDLPPYALSAMSQERTELVYCARTQEQQLIHLRVSVFWGVCSLRRRAEQSEGNGGIYRRAQQQKPRKSGPHTKPSVAVTDTEKLGLEGEGCRRVRTVLKKCGYPPVGHFSPSFVSSPPQQL